jgi:hypothetical protein
MQLILIAPFAVRKCNSLRSAETGSSGHIAVSGDSARERYDFRSVYDEANPAVAEDSPARKSLDFGEAFA